MTHTAVLTVALCSAAIGCATTQAPQVLCRQDMACWPSAADWQRLRASLHGELAQPQSPLDACRRDFAGAECAAAREAAKNPYALQDDPGATQSLGWLGAWTSASSAYAVVAKDERDVQLAVQFAHAHGVRLVIKGTGHDYLGRSSAPDSLLVWTHNLRRVGLNDAFVPDGCPPNTTPQAVLNAEAGTRWLEAYQAAAAGGRYVQGGGCNSVGVAGGFLQGGGFGTWSNKYGIAAAALLEARVVIADGTLLVANACQNPDLFWALKGGGGGTYGVVTQVTLQTHPAPHSMGLVIGELSASDDAAYRELLAKFFAFYASKLMRPEWGEHVRVRGNNSLQVTMSFVDMSAETAKRVWATFVDDLDSVRFRHSLQFVEVPGEDMWTDAFAAQMHDAITTDPRPDQPRPLYWWRSNQEEVSTYWYTYQSRWLQAALFADPTRLADVMFDASRHWGISLYFRKGQASASEDARVRDSDTAMNPVVMHSAALAIAAATGGGAPGVPDHEPNAEEGAEARAEVTAAMNILRSATPDSGSYVNETDYFEPAWQHSFWGANYERLLAIKHKYDPDGVVQCHHCVGSEAGR
jgi:FAD/FMN-containing dehydrogenase